MESDDEFMMMDFSENQPPSSMGKNMKKPKTSSSSSKKKAATTSSSNGGKARKVFGEITKKKQNQMVDTSEEEEQEEFDDEEEEESEDEEDRWDEEEEEQPKKKKKKSITTSTKKSTKEKKQTIEEIYQKKSPIEHILLRPDTYVGSLEKVTQQMWVYDELTNQMQNRTITYVPGLYKIFDEIIVNASDNKQRDPSMNKLKVSIDPSTNQISIWNNGKGIPIVLHKEHQVYVPELIFGHLLTGSNFDDKKKKTTGGRNGYGAKLTNIFSKQFIIETADTKTKQKYRQVFMNNMQTKQQPEITTASNIKEDYTCITFIPDLERFQMDHLDQDILSLFKKRVYDIAGLLSNSTTMTTTTTKGTTAALQVYLNNEKISIKSFQQYVQLYQNTSNHNNSNNPEEETTDVIIFDKPDERWQVGVGLSDDGFQQVSFVNGICTTKGGQHVNYITDQITSKLALIVKKKNKNEAVKAAYIKNHLSVFISALIDNPSFDSQTKENLTTRSNAFGGSSYQLTDKFLKQIEKSGIIDRILSFAKYKQTAELKRKAAHTNNKSKKNKLLGISKLDDANFAGTGTTKSQQCTLILTEGDSAKALAMSGLSVVGRDYYGVFPLKGKLLNVREASHSQILKNEEIQNLVKILGLKYGTKYQDTKTLRYGHLMIMADQDHDGSHIKGLVINFLHHFWPSLVQLAGFLQEFITPIVKCTKKNQIKVFFTLREYDEWILKNKKKGWHIKYYKGLGTSTSKEGKEYFNDLSTHQIGFQYTCEQDEDLIDMAFSKKRVEERKEWLRHFEKENKNNTTTFIDFKQVQQITYTEFINQELILFSMADNLRSIPNVMDGFKPSQRKVLFCCLKRNLTKKEIKVAQLAGYVSEHSAYHHGEMSLNGTIINMAQDFCGSNNINLLSPNGQFGTRLLGGKDAASARYIFTKLEQITCCLFDFLDNEVLDFLQEDGQSIEPKFYAPILPLVLVNGSEGIGTGWSTSIPNYNPFDLIRILRQKLVNEQPFLDNVLIPWYRGFQGTIVPKTSNSFLVQGLYEFMEDGCTLIIKELPVKTWTQNYKQFLENLMENQVIKDFKENHTDTNVLFTITLSEETAKSLLTGNLHAMILKKFKLETSLSTSNMHLFDPQGKIKKYENPLEIVEEFFSLRLTLYGQRKVKMLQKLQDMIRLLSNKTRFIMEVVEAKIKVNNRSKKELMKELLNKKFDQFDGNNFHNDHEKMTTTTTTTRQTTEEETEEEEEEEEEEEDGEEDDPRLKQIVRGYDYLLSMPLWSLTKERVFKLQEELQSKQHEYCMLEAKSIQTLWMEDLETLENLLIEKEKERIALEQKQQQQQQKQQQKQQKKKEGGVKAKVNSKPKTTKQKKKTKTFIVDSDKEEEEDDIFDENESDYEEFTKPKKNSKPKASSTTTAPAAVGAATSSKLTMTSSSSSLTSAAKATSTTATSKSLSKTMKKSTTTSTAGTSKSKPIVLEKEEPEEISEDDDEEDIEVLSLAERLARRVEVTPKKQLLKNLMKKQQQSKSMTKSIPISLTMDDEDEEDEEENEDDIFAMSSKPKATTTNKTKSSTTKTKPNAKTVAVPAATTITSTTTTTTTKQTTLKDFDTFMFDSPSKLQTKPKPNGKGLLNKRPKEKTPKKKQVQKKEKEKIVPRSSPFTKKQKRSDEKKAAPAVIDIVDEEEEEEMVPAPPPPRRQLSERTKKTISYTTYDDDSEDDDEEDLEEEDSEEEEEEEEEEDDDDDSDFEDE